MNDEKISFKRYNCNSVDEYNDILNELIIPNEFYILNKIELKNEKNVFLMFREYTKKFLLFNFNCSELIGYCIVENVNALPESYREYSYMLYSIPLSVLKEYPTVISDCMIAEEIRRNGYGRQLAEYIINDVYKDRKISLTAVGDGIYFWHKFGFEKVDGHKSAMVLKGDNRNA